MAAMLEVEVAVEMTTVVAVTVTAAAVAVDVAVTTTDEVAAQTVMAAIDAAETRPGTAMTTETDEGNYSNLDKQIEKFVSPTSARLQPKVVRTCATWKRSFCRG